MKHGFRSSKTIHELNFYLFFPLLWFGLNFFFFLVFSMFPSPSSLVSFPKALLTPLFMKINEKINGSMRKEIFKIRM